MSRPPALARLLFRLLPLGPRRQEIERDLDDVYGRHEAAAGRDAARRRYRKEVRSLVAWSLRRRGAFQRTASSPTHPAPRGSSMNGMLNDVRHALRSLRRQPDYAALAIATLAVGIASATVMFTLVDGVLLAPLPVHEPAKLMIVWETTPRGQQTLASAANYTDWRDTNEVFENLAIIGSGGATLFGVDEPRRLSGREVSTNLLATVGLQPALGRDFLPEESEPGAEPVVMISYRLWQESFAGDPSIVGQTITLSTGVHTVVGVMPPQLPRAGFGGDVFTPINLRESDWLEHRGRHGMTVVGRLAGGVTEAAAQTQMSQIALRLAEQYPDTNEGYGVDVEPMKAAIVDTAEQPLTMLLAAVGFVLLIACANVANLTLARSVARRGELGVRAALGAGRGRLFRRLAIESGLVAAAAGVLGVGVASAALDAVIAFVPPSIPRLSEVSINGSVLGFGAAASGLTILLSAVLPAIRVTGVGLSEALSGIDPRATGGRGERLLRNGLVVAEMALAVVLLVGAGLFLRSLSALGSVELGVQPAGVMTLRTYLPADPYSDSALARATLGGILERVRALPGVESAAIASHLPLAFQGMNSGFSILGGARSGPDGPGASFRVVSPGYFSTLGVPLLRGRAFTDADVVGQPLVVIVNQELVDRYFPEGALGRQIAYRVDAAGNDIFAQIVGVAGSVRHFGPGLPPVAEIYEPLGQAEETFRWFGSSLAIVARSADALAPLGTAMRGIVREADPNLPVYQVQRLDDFLAERTAAPRFQAGLLSLFGALAVGLAGIGVFGVLSLHVRTRRREIGLRQALGADRTMVIRGVVATGLGLAASGSAIGLIAAVLLTRLVSGLLYGVGAIDPVAYLATPLVLAAIACLACWVPARRAARVDPAVALRGR